MKNVFVKSGLFAICAVLTASAQQERSPFGSPAAGANVQLGGAQAGVQANVSQQMTTPLLLNLAGTAVKDESGQQLGQIQHLIVSPQGCVDMAVLSLGGAKLVPVPWQLVELSSVATATATPGAQARTTLSLNVDRQKLQQAPSFSMNQINQITQQQTIQQVFSFYGVQQSQSGVGGSASQSSTIQGGATSTNATQSSSQFGTSTTQTNQFGTSATQTNQFGSRPSTQFGNSSTNQLGGQSSATNAAGQLSPTGRTNGYPNRPSLGNTNTPPGRPDFAPGRPENRPPANRPPENRPPTNTPQGQPFQDTPTPQGQQ